MLGSEEAREAVDAQTLDQIADMLAHLQLCREGKAFPAFAAAIAQLAGEDKLTIHRDTHARNHWGYVLGTPETRGTVKAVLIDGTGSPRVEIARILSHAYRDSPERASWIEYLDGKVEESAGKGDVLARWFLARAYAASAYHAVEPTPLQGIPWLNQALGAAGSEACRLEVLRVLVDEHVAAGDFAAPATLVASVLGQFSEEGSLASVEAMREGIARSKAEYITMRAEHKAEQARSQKAARKRVLQKRLAKATRLEDEQEVQRLRRLLGLQ